MKSYEAISSERVKNRAPDGKNPIVDFKRLICKLCLSEDHFFRECPKLTPAKRIQLLKTVFEITNVDSESDQCYEAMEETEGFDSEKWNSVYAVLHLMMKI